MPCFSNRPLQELEKSVISKIATLRGPVSNANHRFVNQSISRYVLIAYYVQRQIRGGAGGKCGPDSTKLSCGCSVMSRAPLPLMCPELSGAFGKMQILIQEVCGGA